MKYKCLIFLAMLYVLLDIFPWLLHNKDILIPMGYSFNNEHFIPASLLVSLLWFSLCDIIAEVYGMKLSIKLFWSSTICKLLVATYLTLLLNLPSPAFWNEQHSFNAIYKNMLPHYCLSTFTIVIAWYVNIHFLTKWKILTRGKYFWLRSIGSSLSGQMALIILTSSIRYLSGSYIYVSNIKELFIMDIWDIIFWTIATILLAFPSSIIVNLLKIIEYHSNKKTEYTAFNPFLPEQKIQ